MSTNTKGKNNTKVLPVDERPATRAASEAGKELLEVAEDVVDHLESGAIAEGVHEEEDHASSSHGGHPVGAGPFSTEESAWPMPARGEVRRKGQTREQRANKAQEGHLSPRLSVLAPAGLEESNLNHP